MTRKILASALALCLLLGSTTTVALAYYETDPELEYIRVSERLVEQFDLDLGDSGSPYFINGTDTASTNVPGFVGLIYTKTETGTNYGNATELINATYLLAMTNIPFETGGVRLSGTTDTAGRILNLIAEMDMTRVLDFRKADEVAREVAEEIISKTGSKREMVILANQYLVDNVFYPKVVDESKTYLWNAHGALVHGEAVCQGYTAAFQLLMQHLDIPVLSDFGIADGQQHVWNQVKIDGQWLYVDVTFNDPIVSGGRPSASMLAQWSKEYLLLTEEEFYDKDKHKATYEEYTKAAKEVFFRNELVEEADALKTAGLFYGDAKGYRLEDGLTRAEMAIMLTRVIGATAAIESNPTFYAALCPFTDVPDWAKPYVGYSVSQGLIKGIGNNLYGSTMQASKLDYSTVMLRAIGATGFTYRDSDKKAVELRFLSIERAAFSDLTRGDVVYMTHALWEQGQIRN